MHTRFLPSVTWALVLLAPSLARSWSAAPPDPTAVAAQALRIVSRQKAVFTAPPGVMPTRKVPDGPLLGNGDLGVVIGGVVERRKYFGLGESGGAQVHTAAIEVTNCPERHRFYISKNDFWKTKAIYPNAHPCPIGGIDVNIPALVNGSETLEGDRLTIKTTPGERLTLTLAKEGP